MIAVKFEEKEKDVYKRQVRDPGGVPQDEEQHGQQYEQGDADGPHRAASFRRHTTAPC